MKPWTSAEPGFELLRELGAVALAVSGTSLMLLSVYLYAAAMYRLCGPGAAAQGGQPRAVALVGPLFALASGFSAAGYVGAVWPDGNPVGIGFVAVVGVVVALILLAALSGAQVVWVRLIVEPDRRDRLEAGELISGTAALNRFLATVPKRSANQHGVDRVARGEAGVMVVPAEGGCRGSGRRR